MNAFSPRLDRRVYAKLGASEEIAACILSHAADESPLSERRESEKEEVGREGETEGEGEAGKEAKREKRRAGNVAAADSG